MDKKYEVKYYPGDHVWQVHQDENMKYYAEELVVLSVGIWPTEGVLYNLVLTEQADCLETLEQEFYRGILADGTQIFATKEEAEKAAGEMDANRRDDIQKPAIG